MIFKWNDNYRMHIEAIDIQHKKLFEIGSGIYEILSLKDNFDHYDEIIAALGELRDYTAYHFGYEENLMGKWGYANLEQHKIEHRFFVKKLEKIAQKDPDNDQSQSMIDIISFLADWITNHILHTDIDYKEFFIQKNISC